MASRDYFSGQLKCPTCGKSGKVELSERDGASYAFGDKRTRVEKLPDGFVAVDSPSKIATVDFHCSEHAVSAVV